MLFSSCAILWRVLSVCRPYPWYFAGFPIDDVFRNWELDVAGSWTSDVYRWMRTAPAASYLQPLEGIPFFPRFHLSGVLFFFTFSTGAGAVRPCTAITHCRKRLNVFMCKRLSLKLPAGLSLCAALYTSLSSLHSPAAFHNSN